MRRFNIDGARFLVSSGQWGRVEVKDVPCFTQQLQGQLVYLSLWGDIAFIISTLLLILTGRFGHIPNPLVICSLRCMMILKAFGRAEKVAQW